MSLDFKNNIKNFKTTSLAICRRNLSRTMSWTVFPRIYTNLQSKVCFQFSLSSTARNFNNSRPIYVIFWEMRNHYRNVSIMKNSKCLHFLFLKKWPQKWTNFSTFYLIFKPSDYHKATNFLLYTTSWGGFLKFELKKDSFFINFFTKASWKTL